MVSIKYLTFINFNLVIKKLLTSQNETIAIMHCKINLLCNITYVIP